MPIKDTDLLAQEKLNEKMRRIMDEKWGRRVKMRAHYKSVSKRWEAAKLNSEMAQPFKARFI